MKLLAAILLTLSLLAGVVQAQTTPVDPRIGQLESHCTVEMISPFLPITASHCVGRLGANHRLGFYGKDTSDVQWETAVVVWDGSYESGESNPLTGVDFAVLYTPTAHSSYFAIADRLPNPGDQLDSVSFSLRIRQWRAHPVAVGLFYLVDFGWAFMARGSDNPRDSVGLLYPGASGSVLTDRQGKIVSMVNVGEAGSQLFGGVPQSQMLQALADLGKYGSMRCGDGRGSSADYGHSCDPQNNDTVHINIPDHVVVP